MNTKTDSASFLSAQTHTPRFQLQFQLTPLHPVITLSKPCPPPIIYFIHLTGTLIQNESCFNFIHSFGELDGVQGLEEYHSQLMAQSPMAQVARMVRNGLFRGFFFYTLVTQTMISCIRAPRELGAFKAATGDKCIHAAAPPQKRISLQAKSRGSGI